LVLLPPHAHGDLELEVARRVPAALFEKPVSNDLAAAERAAEAFEKAGTLVSVGYMNRYRQTTSKVRELLGAANRPVLINGWWITEIPPPLWWRTKAQSGGQFVEQCTHLVDLARWIGGEITSVSAFSTRGFVDNVADYTVDDAVTVNARFVGGALGNFTTGCFPQGNPSTGRGTDGVGMTFASRSTQCTLTGWAMDLAWKDNHGAGAIVESTEDIFEVQDRAFVEAVRSGDRSGIRSSYPDGVRTLRVTLAAEKSALTGQVVVV
jgi:predicted dehydrogenase